MSGDLLSDSLEVVSKPLLNTSEDFIKIPRDDFQQKTQPCSKAAAGARFGCCLFWSRPLRLPGQTHPGKSRFRKRFRRESCIYSIWPIRIILENRYGSDCRPSRAMFPLVFHDKTPWFQMTAEAMQSALMLEYLKHAIGKTHPKRIAALLDF
jgi:hypothetical protein